jgi:predicted PurR-regulated permease PerM
MRPLKVSSSGVLRDKAFVLLLAIVSLAFAWILLPFYGAILWATVLAILFRPLYERLARRMPRRPTVGALATTALILLLVILPCALIAGLLAQEALGVYARIASGELNFGRYVEQALGALPEPVRRLVARFGPTDFASIQQNLSSALMRSIQFLGTHAVNVGQNTLDFLVSFFIMLYLLFFLLRDGRELSRRIRDSVPLDARLQSDLFGKFANVIRATIKGTVVVAVVQGALGGLIFALLGIQAPVFWGVVMAFLSLLPAVGTALVWLPVAIYFLVTGELRSGVILIAYGVVVIGLVDNVVRPILVGKQTKVPDYVVLVATLGGMSVFGLNGFVIGPLVAAMFIAVWDVVRTSPADGSDPQSVAR